MSESEVSQIRDEDVLRRMWQQTEDFGRKKEIRAHMYKLREERLRDLYSPEPALQGKGCEFSSAHAQRHGQSFADQSFQSMKSKEVRDASSPSKEFSYRGQELKDLSNAGWNVSAEERTADGGRTHINTVHADIEGQYAVEGGRGRFAAADRQRSQLTELQDERGSLRRREAAADSSSHDRVERVAADGTRVSTTTSSSNTSSKVEQVSSRTQGAPIEDYDRDTNRGERVTRLAADEVGRARAGEPTPRAEPGAELVSRKVEYPDDSTRVVVETRVLPDGTRVTSTHREFRAPAHATRSEYHSTHSSSHADRRETSTARHATRTRSDDIVDSQRHVDDQDFKRQLREYSTRDDDESARRHRVTDTGSEVIDRSRTNDDDYTQSRHETRINSKIVDRHQSTTERTDRSSERRVVDRDHSTAERDDRSQTDHRIVDRRNDYVSSTDDNDTAVTRDRDVQRKIIKETRYVNDSEENIKNVSRDRKETEEVITHTSKSRTVPEIGDREIPKDKTIPVDKPLNIPRDSTPTREKIRDVSQERPITADTPRDAPWNETVPGERFNDAPRDHTTPRDRPSDIPVERVDKEHYVKNDTKTEEVIERKTSSDHYQTTYQSDFQSRKVSTDWSPTHQAWASTLRSDTPSTTRPSTRASSPGSKTFKSSTSSLRSSVSPDKTHRKPTSRGGSPNKVDRFSPTRTVISDRHSSTHSTHSVTEERLTKNTSPERKPPTGRSPTRPGYSPDRKPQDNCRQRPSTSPDKKPKHFSDRPNSSPERKLVDGRHKTTLPTDNKKASPMEPRQSPERRPTKPTSHSSNQFSSDTYPRTSPYRSTSSPDRKIVDHFDRPSPRSSVSPDRRPKPNQSQKPIDSTVSEFPKTTSPSKPQYRPDITPKKPSPDRKTGTDYPSGQPKQKSVNNTPDYKDVPNTKRPSSSPERKPGYMRPTAASQPEENTKRPSGPEHDLISMLPNLKKENTKIKEDHYRFVDEETKVYTFTDRIEKDNNVVKTITEDYKPRDASPSHISHLPSEDSTDYCEVPKHRESPKKNTVTDTENDELYGRIDKTVEINNVTTTRDKQTHKNTTTTRITRNKEVSEEKDAPNRATSPVKYGTYDKKKQKVDNTENITITSINAKNDIKTDSLIHRDTVSPKKHPEAPMSPTKKSPRDSVSPVKSSTKDVKHKHTTDFISTERNTEEKNKKTTTKDRPRQLVTPSSSPTRKPKLPETEPSTGQSSPTTSVSGFVYFGSPRTEKSLVTDLDEFYPESEYPEETLKRPETLDVKRSPSPSKIPCRSPSPEKQTPTTKDSLPRKSSLKKPSSDLNQASPVEKPPTSFRVTPTQDGPDVLDHKVVKKDQPHETVKGEPEIAEPKFSEKPKPPLQRRETYDDRCKKMLGLVDDTTIETIVRETKKPARKPNSTQSSPSVSPCDSPTLTEPSPFSSYPSSKITTKTDVTNFIAHEREDLTKTTTITDQQKTKNPSRDSSPTKLQDITRKTSLVTEKTTRSVVEDVVGNSTKFTSPEKIVPQDSNIKYPDQNPEKQGMPSPSTLTQQVPTRSDLSPERQSLHTHTKGTSPSRKSPEKNPSNKRIDTTVTSIIYDSTSDIKDSTKISQETRILKSPTRDTSKPNNSITDHTTYPRSSSPSKQKPKDGLSSRKTSSPERTVESDFPEYSETKSHEQRHDTHLRESTEKIPGYMKTTTAITSKYDTRLTSEELTETHKTRTQEKEVTKSKTPSSSPTRHSPRNRTPSLVEQSGVIKTKSDTSPQRKPAQTSSTKQPDADQKKPGYMKTTMTSTTKFDKTTVSQDIQETTSAKTSVEKKNVSGSVSPTRKPIQPKSSERTHSPTKPNRPSEISIDKKSSDSQPSSPVKDNPTKKHQRPTSSTQSAPQKVPGYMKTTTSTTLRHDTSEYDDVITEEGFEEQITATITDREHSRVTQSPSRRTTKPTDRSSPERLRTTSPATPSTYDLHRRQDSPERKQGYPQKNQLTEKPSSDRPISISPTRDGAPDYTKTTTSKISKFETISTTEDEEVNNTFKHVQEKLSSESPANEHSEGCRPRSVSPSKPRNNSSKTPERKPNPVSTVNDSESLVPGNKYTPVRTSESPERPSYMKPTAAITSKFDSTVTIRGMEYTSVLNVDKTKSVPKESPSKESPERTPKNISDYLSKPEEPRQLRTPSPTKKTTTTIQTNTDFIMSEREQEILNKVQKSLRKLSPERKEKSPIREKSPTKSTTSLQDLDIVASERNEIYKSEHEKITESVEEQSNITTKVHRSIHLKEDKPKDQKSFNKPSRNVSPIKRVPSTTNKIDKTPDSPTKARSFSPKKPISNVDRPQSPQLAKSSGIKPREHIPLTRKPTPATLSTTRIERLATDVKKSNVTTKQNMFIKTNHPNRSIPSPTSKVSETDIKRTTTHKKDNLSPRKDTVTRTASDTAMKLKKPSSPQRMKSKPEIQVSDMSTKTPKSQKFNVKEPHLKLPSKPKSATSLNTSIDDDDIIIDVQQSKSSRENSPDRICPTPINFSDDVGVPRFPDEVSEPDDELIKRTHHTIHETESVVDDIVEICEDEELFVKKSDMEDIYEQDDSFLSVNDKVNKFTSKIHSAKKPKDATSMFKDTERKVHSDFVDDKLKSDECLLTVSEKVNKFAKGPRDTKDSRSPSRKITDEYDKETVYTDDYTKLSVNDKAHLFVETAENVRTTKVKRAQKMERPDLSEVDESLRSDDCLLSVSDKVNKFVKTAEQSISETQNTEETETKHKQQHEKIVKEIEHNNDKENHKTNETVLSEETYTIIERPIQHPEDNLKPRAQEYKPSQSKVREHGNASLKPVDRVPAVKITTLRSSEAVKKAKALFENIASTQKTSRKETTTHVSKTTKLTDIGVTKKTPKTVPSTVSHTPLENVTQDADLEVDDVFHTECPSRNSVAKPQHIHTDEKPRSSPSRLMTQSPEVPRSKSPTRQSVEVTATKTVLSRYPVGTRAESPRHRPESPKPRTESPKPRTDSPRHRPDSDKLDKVPGYLRPTKTSQIKEETKVEETEVSSRRGSGKFGVELRRTSVERSTVSSERRRSIEHHQPCIEDIFDLDLLEQMLEKVMGYEQRRRIRAQIRIAKIQSEHVETTTHTKAVKHTTTTPKPRSPERKITKSPERTPKSTPQRTSSPDSYSKPTSQKTVPNRSQPKEPAINGHARDMTKISPVNRQRPQSPEKPAPKSSLAPKTPVRQPSPDKRRTTSPSKATPKPKGNRFNEYASAYMKKVGISDSDKLKFTVSKNKKITNSKQTMQHESQEQTVQEFTTTKSFSDRTSSKDVVEIFQTNGKRSPSPEQRRSPDRKVQFPECKLDSPDHKAYSPDRKITNYERKPQSPERKPQSPERKVHSPEREKHSPERLHQRTPSPDFKRPKAETVKETIIKTVYDVEKKIPSKSPQDEKPSWVTNRNLKKTTSESRTFSSKKIENEKPKYRAPSPSKVISKPIDVITSSYGPGPLDADGKPLFGIKALRNGGSNFQVKGTVVRQEFHSRNGGAPEGSVSVTAYSSQPEDLEVLLATQGEPPSRLRGLAAITTTRKFGGDSGNTLANAHTKEDRASLEHFTHHDRRVEHLETSYGTRTEEFGDFSIEDVSDNSREVTDTRIEDITENTRKTDSKKETRRDRTERRKEEKVTDTKRQKVEERREKMERREDKKTVRQSSVRSLTEKFIKSANDSGKADRTAYPKAGLILRTTAMRDSVSSDDALPGLQRTDSEHSVCSVDDTEVTSTERVAGGVRTTTRTTRHHHHHTTHHEPAHTATKTVISHEPVITTRKTMIVTQEPVVTSKRTTIVTQEPVLHRAAPGRQGAAPATERSFLDSSTKVTGVQDILTRMKNADIVVQEGDSTEDAEARALLNKFLGATVLMAGMQGYVHEPSGASALHQETVITSSGGKVSRQSVEEIDLDQCWDERLLKKLLEECTEYEQRRKLRARIRTLMAEQEACASAVSEALGACSATGADAVGADGADGESREEEEVIVTSSVRRDSSDKTVSSSTTTKTSKVIEMTRSAPKPVSPFAKFRQLEKQNSTNSPNSPKTPQSPGSTSQPYFKFTDPALQCSALTIKERLLQWCRDKTRDYENVKLENFSTSWADGLAFCALVHHFLPTTFDYSKLTPERRRHNFTLAFKVADEKAGIYPLLDVDDMVAMRKPDWKCVFTYVQAIYRRFKDEP